MASVFDVAAYILDKQGTMTTMKLQKLVYYSKAWHLAWTGNSLFPQRIEAWANGPVCPDLYQEHKGEFRVSHLPSGKGNPANVTDDEKASIDSVLNAYGDMQPYELIDQTHSEAPWRDARRGVPDGARSHNEITDAAMYDFYSYPDADR
ncbi:type II toxin-antitoxin system antitoxin SocA domain-containing protein [Bifidobacterium sp. SO1]|uniref:Panacea domain-containing protein n=1 Tax=Bifidobacterium sp. SO1 TaxID=2809029 RepID=UPI001BDDB588|nr:type II toxin-antitoxin system antitoxin SocA domain-containing protein [Bifidobacterium sp. SO1]MBT1162093.1 DUF4065 domain-containing protein [Bifidobacterium sp. SO1]